MKLSDKLYEEALMNVRRGEYFILPTALLGAIRGDEKEFERMIGLASLFTHRFKMEGAQRLLFERMIGRK